MPRKKAMTEAELIAERDRIDAEIKSIRVKENTELGETVKKIFGKYLPDSKSERIAFFKDLKAMLDAKSKATVTDANIVLEEKVDESIVQTNKQTSGLDNSVDVFDGK